MAIYDYYDIAPMKLVQLTKWLTPSTEELEYLLGEHKRISSDKNRQCRVAIFEGKIAIFVNDLTDGVFERLGSE